MAADAGAFAGAVCTVGASTGALPLWLPERSPIEKPGSCESTESNRRLFSCCCSLLSCAACRPCNAPVAAAMRALPRLIGTSDLFRGKENRPVLGVRTGQVAGEDARAKLCLSGPVRNNPGTAALVQFEMNESWREARTPLFFKVCRSIPKADAT